MSKNMLSKEVVEPFVLLTILALTCIISGFVLGSEWNELSKDQQRYEFGRKLEHCIGKKLEGYHYNEDAFFKNKISSKKVSNNDG
jgi:hypothetical protein